MVVSFTHAWTLERVRLERDGRGPWHPHNWVLLGTVLSCAMFGVVFATWGVRAALASAPLGFSLSLALWGPPGGFLVLMPAAPPAPR